MTHFDRWGDACRAVLSGRVSCFTYVAAPGKVFERENVVASLGYDGAERAGVLDEYRRIRGIA